jgi:hypothetical protein
MNSFPLEQSPSPPRAAVPLGRLLVERGLLTEEQLIEGLFEQDRTGDRLGKVLIRLGFVDAPSVAMALASQHGGPLKTEYGFATGFDSGAQVESGAKAPEGPDTATSQALSSELRLADPPDVTAGGSPAPADPIVESVEGGPGGNRERDTELRDLQTFAAELDRAQSQVAATIAERDAARAELDGAHTRIADLDGELVAAREQLDDRRSRIAELEDTLAAAQLAAETAIAALRQVTEGPP